MAKSKSSSSTKTVKEKADKLKEERSRLNAANRECISLKSLEQKFIKFADIYRIWGVNKRYPEAAIQRFISLNKRAFDFLHVDAKFHVQDYAAGVLLESHRYVGACPLKNPRNGKYYGDLSVEMSLADKNESIADLIVMLEELIEPEFLETLPLQNVSHLKAPDFLYCINYFKCFVQAQKVRWTKFDVQTKIEDHPSGSTNWTKYAQHTASPANWLRFENRKNVQSSDHQEWQELVYVLKIAIERYEACTLSPSVRARYGDIFRRLKSYAMTHNSHKREELFRKQVADPAIIKELKEHANKLLKRDLNNESAWRLDSAELFERYAQYVFSGVAAKLGARLQRNPKYSCRYWPYVPGWGLRYLEPDMTMQYAGQLWHIDAKYKAHALNTRFQSETLKESFRSDMHQILAYSSFDVSAKKCSALVYPYFAPEENEQKVKILTIEVAPHQSSVKNRLYLIGIPFSAKSVKTCQDTILAVCFKVDTKSF